MAVGVDACQFVIELADQPGSTSRARLTRCDTQKILVRKAFRCSASGLVSCVSDRRPYSQFANVTRSIGREASGEPRFSLPTYWLLTSTRTCRLLQRNRAPTLALPAQLFAGQLQPCLRVREQGIWVVAEVWRCGDRGSHRVLDRVVRVFEN